MCRRGSSTKELGGVLSKGGGVQAAAEPLASTDTIVPGSGSGVTILSVSVHHSADRQQDGLSLGFCRKQMWEMEKGSWEPSRSPSLLPAFQFLQCHKAHVLKVIFLLAQALPFHLCILNKLSKGLNFTEKEATVTGNDTYDTWGVYIYSFPIVIIMPNLAKLCLQLRSCLM